MLTVVLPAYNESADLGAVLAHIGAALAPAGRHEILVVDDGSTDETSAIAGRAALNLPVRVLSHPVNRGYGRALRTGLMEAVRSGGTVITLDADGSHDPALIASMLVEIEAGYDLVIASRFRVGGAEIGVPWNRRLLSRSASLVFRSTLSMDGVRDYTSGYRAYRSTLLERMIGARGEGAFLSSANFAAGFELLLNAASLGARVTEVPLILHYDRKRSASKMRVARDLPPYLSLLVGHHFLPRPTKSGS
jgi:dolichol-phosphate mannosyltransferase